MVYIDFLEQIIPTLDQYSTLITASATIAVAVATIIYAGQNRILIKRSRLSNKPHIDIELTHALKLIVKNIGKTAAYNISLETQINIKRKKDSEINGSLSTYRIKYLQTNKNEDVPGFGEKLKALLMESNVLGSNYKEIQTGSEEYTKFHYLELKESFNVIIDLICHYESEVEDSFDERFSYNVFFFERSPEPFEEEQDTDDRFTTNIFQKNGKWDDESNS